MQLRVTVVTDTPTPTHKQTDRTDYNTLRSSFASAQCKKMPVTDINDFRSSDYD